MRNIKKNRRKKLLIWLTIDIIVAIVIICLLRHKPRGYQTPTISLDPNTSGYVHQYITYLASELYNGTQYGQPFDLTILEEGINQAILLSGWPRYTEEILFFAPVLRLQEDMAQLMVTMYCAGSDLVLTVTIRPMMNDQGQLNLHVDNVRIGALTITPLARLIAQKIYADQWPASGIDDHDLRTKLAGSLLHDVPFDPVFRLEDKYVRLDRFKMGQGHIIVHLVPLPRN